jgi:hypothetical protein
MLVMLPAAGWVHQGTREQGFSVRMAAKAERSSRRVAVFAVFWQSPQHGYWRESLHWRSLPVFSVGELAVAKHSVVSIPAKVKPATALPGAALPVAALLVAAMTLMPAEVERW